MYYAIYTSSTLERNYPDLYSTKVGQSTVDSFPNEHPPELTGDSNPDLKMCLSGRSFLFHLPLCQSSIIAVPRPVAPIREQLDGRGGSTFKV